jgi:ketosteroid isomerase-like protein
MSQENIQLIRAAIDAMNANDVDALLEMAAPGFEYDVSRAVGPFSGVYSLDESARVWEEFAGAWESVRYEADEFIESGEHVVTPFTNYLRGRDGIEVQARAAFVWTIRDGTIARLSFYQERAEALEAVGLSEQDAHTDS